jgi:glutathione synthase/RimK-type ligase-like ATP-grasp enzyme
MCILILGAADDDHASFMREHLHARGIDVELLDSRSFPSATSITFEPRGGTATIRLPHGRVLRLDEIRSVYWRNYMGVDPPPMADPEQAYIAANDSRSLFESLLESRQLRWVNGRRAFELHQVKPAALAMVAQLGIPVPRTVLTNDPAAVRRFVAEVPASIFKPVQGGAHTRRVEPRHLTDENLAHLVYAPVTLQEEIPGTNLRVFVAGERAFCIEVRTGAVDFRDDELPELIACELPLELETWSRQVAERLELVWTGIDWRRTPAGDHYFLEANPSPMFLGFEEATGVPLTESLTRLLDAPGK